MASPGCRRVGVLQVSLSLIPSGLPCGQPSACLTPSLRPEGLRCALPLAAFPTGNADQVDDAGRCPEPRARRVAGMLGRKCAQHPLPASVVPFQARQGFTSSRPRPRP